MSPGAPPPSRHAFEAFWREVLSPADSAMDSTAAAMDSATAAAMDCCMDSCSEGDGSQADDLDYAPHSPEQAQYLDMADRIIDALPDAIKAPAGGGLDPVAPGNGGGGDQQQLLSPLPPRDRLDEFSSMQHEGYRSLYEPSSPGGSTLSQSDTGSCLSSASLLEEVPSTAQWSEFLHASYRKRMIKDFEQLTLSDAEKRQLYEAAKVIQDAFRKYQKKQKEMEVETAVVVIQSYYRRFKQYAMYRRMTRAAVLIQNQFRSYYEQKQYRRKSEAARVIQKRYRSYREHERGGDGCASGRMQLQCGRTRSDLKREHMAARKIQRFLRQNKHRILWDVLFHMD